MIAFDFKGDLGTDASGGGYRLDELFEARTLEPPRAPIPLDVLSLSSRGEIDVAEAASRFRESFSRLKGSRLGDRQRTALHEAASRALAAESPCELHHIRDALISVYAEHEMKEDGAIATMQELCRFPLFEPTYDPAAFFQQSWIIKLPPNVAEDCRTIVVNLVLDALDQYLNSLMDAERSADGSRGLGAGPVAAVLSASAGLSGTSVILVLLLGCLRSRWAEARCNRVQLPPPTFAL